MTNSPIDSLSTQLIAALDADDFDLLDTLTALRLLINAHHFADLALQCDICPMHICDIAICADDDIDECAHHRN